MASRKNEHGQPIGLPVLDWRGATAPVREPIQGTHCRLEPLAAQTHAAALFRAYAADPKCEQPVGVAAYLRISPLMGSIEVGHLSYSPALQRTAAATDAMYRMMKRVFDDWGYRRYEWKCDALNAPSRAAATRLGFRFEGVFRKLMVLKGRNRDTAWYSIVDDEWPGIRGAFEAWLAPSNFDAEGRQRRRLEEFMPPSAGEPTVLSAPA